MQCVVVHIPAHERHWRAAMRKHRESKDRNSPCVSGERSSVLWISSISMPTRRLVPLNSKPPLRLHTIRDPASILGDAGPTITPPSHMYRARVTPAARAPTRPSALRRANVFVRPLLFFALRPPGHDGTSYPAASTVSEPTPSAAVIGEAMPSTDVSSEKLRTKLRGMKLEPRLDTDTGGGSAKAAGGGVAPR